MPEQKIHYIDFYFQRFFSSTKGWKDDEVGAYVRLLMEQAETGHIPEDPEEIGRLITTFKKNWHRLSKKFKAGEVPGTLQNEFMKEIREKAVAKVEANAMNGKKGGRPKKPIKTQRKATGFDSETDGLATANPSPNPTETQPKAIPVTSNQEPIKEKIEKENGGWNYYPGQDLDLDLEPMEITTTSEFIFRLKQISLTGDRLINFWSAFCLNLTGEAFYQGRSDLIKHFRNWLKSQDLNSKPAATPESSPVRNLIENRTNKILDQFS